MPLACIIRVPPIRTGILEEGVAQRLPLLAPVFVTVAAHRMLGKARLYEF